MDLDKVTIVVCLTLFVVIGIAALNQSLHRRGNQTEATRTVGQAATRARSPWQHEDEALEELSDLISQLHTDKGTQDSKAERNEP